jgi:hypothetical protein
LKRRHDKSTYEGYFHNPNKVEENDKIIGNDTLENKVYVISNINGSQKDVIDVWRN